MRRTRVPRVTSPTLPPGAYPSADAVHLWTCEVSDSAESGFEARAATLDETERARAARYVRVTDRRHYIVAHSMLRDLLSAYTGIAPRDFVFDTGPHGRPFIAEPAMDKPLWFNLSHTRGRVGCAFASNTEPGFDIEFTGRATNTAEIASRYFAREELAWLERECPTDETRRLGFFTLWTLKESYVKARGMGLSLPLNSFAITPSGCGTLRLCAASGIDPLAGQWQFYAPPPADGYALAVAARIPGPSRLEVIHRTYAPPSGDAGPGQVQAGSPNRDRHTVS